MGKEFHSADRGTNVLHAAVCYPQDLICFQSQCLQLSERMCMQEKLKPFLVAAGLAALLAALAEACLLLVTRH